MIRLLYRAISYNFNFMSAKKWLALPEGTKVRMICDFIDFKEWEIVTRVLNEADDDISVMFNWDNVWQYLADNCWELIEEPKEELLIQDANGNLTKSDSFWIPKQRDIIQVRERADRWWIDEAFVAFFDGKAITTPWWDEFNIWNEWRFPEWFEEVTLKNGLTYEVQWNDDDELVLKLKELR